MSLHLTQSAINIAETILETPDGATSTMALRGALSNLLAVTKAQQNLLRFRESICMADERGRLLQTIGVCLDDIKRVIDPEALGVTEEYCREQSKLSHSGLDENLKFIDKRKRPVTDEEVDRYYVTEMCMPYNPPPDDRDVFVYYNNIGALCGASGYLRIRDGVVYGHKVYMRS